MRASVPLTIIWATLVIPVVSDCRHPNGNIQTDAYHAPCAEKLGNPLNTMCCAIDRPNPPGGLAADGFSADICLPNGLCKNSWRDSENSTLEVAYWREECTVEGWKNGSCLTVCLSNSASSNVIMTPCDGTDNSTRWCCGDTKDCCVGDIGVETLAQTFLGTGMTSTSSSSSSSTTTSTSPSSSSSPATSSASSDDSAGLSAGAIAGIVVGAVIGVAVIFAAWFFLSRRRRNASSPAPDKGQPLDELENSNPQKTYYAYEADANEMQVSELPGANANATAQKQPAVAHELQ